MLITYLLNYFKVCSQHKMKKVSGCKREKREKRTVEPVPFELLSGHTKYTVSMHVKLELIFLSLLTNVKQ